MGQHSADPHPQISGQHAEDCPEPDPLMPEIPVKPQHQHPPGHAEMRNDRQVFLPKAVNITHIFRQFKNTVFQIGFLK